MGLPGAIGPKPWAASASGRRSQSSAKPELAGRRRTGLPLFSPCARRSITNVMHHILLDAPALGYKLGRSVAALALLGASDLKCTATRQ